MAAIPLESKATLITSDILQTFIARRLLTEPDESLAALKGVDLTRELRGKTFRLVQLILQHPLQEMISNGPPSLVALGDKCDSFFVLYVSECDHLNDKMQWFVRRKMNVKLILLDEAKKVYKVKNAKSDGGLVVMRRQTWHDVDSGWRRHEYKIFQDEMFYKPQPDGSLTVHTRRVLSDFPSLVHYFRKAKDVQRSSSSKRRLDDSEMDDDEDHMDTSAGQASHPMTPAFGAEPRLATPIPMVASTTTTTVSSLPMVSTAQMSFLAPHAVPMPAGPSPPPLLSGLSITSLLSNNHEELSPFVAGAAAGAAAVSPSLSMSGSIMATTGAGNASVYAQASAMGIDNQFGSFTGTDEMQADELFPYNEYLSPGTTAFLPPSPQHTALQPARASSASPHQPPVPDAPPLVLATFAPDSAPGSDFTRVIAVVRSRNDAPLPPFGPSDLKCVFDGQEIPAKLIAPNTLEIMAPPHTPGMIYFWVVIKDPKLTVTDISQNDGLASPLRTEVCYSNAVAFFYTPADADGRLSLAYTLNAAMRNMQVMSKWRHTVRELDLSYNSLDSLDFLTGFYNLTTLILDHNSLTENTRFPSLPQLHTLSLNHNLIRDIQITKFIPNLSLSFPKLQMLFTLGNEACPVFSALAHRYYNYRIYLLSCLPNLRHLDSSPISDEERKHAASITGGTE